MNWKDIILELDEVLEVKILNGNTVSVFGIIENKNAVVNKTYKHPEVTKAVKEKIKNFIEENLEREHGKMSIFQNINKMTQREFVEQQLVEQGFIDRNFCLRNYISRLGAIIANLKSDRWEFETEWIKVQTHWGTGTDYRYNLVKEGKRYAKKN